MESKTGGVAPVVPRPSHPQCVEVHKTKQTPTGGQPSRGSKGCASETCTPRNVIGSGMAGTAVTLSREHSAHMQRTRMRGIGRCAGLNSINLL